MTTVNTGHPLDSVFSTPVTCWYIASTPVTCVQWALALHHRYLVGDDKCIAFSAPCTSYWFIWWRSLYILVHNPSPRHRLQHHHHHPCHHLSKYAIASLGPLDDAETTTVCEDDRGSLSCPSGQVLYVYYATYGRDNRTTCSNLPVDITDCETETFVFGRVRTLCSGRQDCHLSPETPGLGNPCPGTSKYLTVYHACRGELYLITDSPEGVTKSVTLGERGSEKRKCSSDTCFMFSQGPVAFW